MKTVNTAPCYLKPRKVETLVKDKVTEILPIVNTIGQDGTITI